MNNMGFQFKQFRVNHDRCAMKVGTDGILLGAWANVTQAKQILDLGCGSGLIALMLAQRSSAESRICAVEIDPAAAQQAQENVSASPWKDKIQVYQQNIETFCAQSKHAFDLIVANPPYFQTGVDCRNEARNTARYLASQSHLHWLETAASCLASKGKISFVLPLEAGETLLKTTALYCVERCYVTTKQGKMPQRMLLTFAMQPQPLQHSRLIIYDAHHRYHDDFVALTREFYLKF
ncbi:tRNA (adenine-N6)-methyltransferase [Aggregatibacter actinomycetemcomitans D11S-1]|uniref:tRNA1(Val) (adenine(37)-N6)-methyltransferase n=1 Tax=Aggregatibacter actinomycetemcomitans TaxID=714 RepID=UPI0005D237B2|nr:tRNA1(Val) (adenine(37)-N6)-methyltransferase [Aggregatibacter actinomycetemcomitans]ACX81598.2 tRNA (adenine-N6)-methyltransferase [Aggregatibacter actinomycetemcomitans D11S-1]